MASNIPSDDVLMTAARKYLTDADLETVTTKTLIVEVRTALKYSTQYFYNAYMTISDGKGV
jgi:hypothetical protein